MKPHYVFNDLRPLNYMAIVGGALVGESLSVTVRLPQIKLDRPSVARAIQWALDPLNDKLLMAHDQVSMVDLERKVVPIANQRSVFTFPLRHALLLPAAGLAAMVAERISMQLPLVAATDVVVAFERWTQLPAEFARSVFKFSHLVCASHEGVEHCLRGRSSFIAFSGSDRLGGTFQSVVDLVDGMIFASAQNYKEGKLHLTGGSAAVDASSVLLVSGEPTLDVVAETLYNRARYVLARTGCTGFYLTDGFHDGVFYEI